MRADRHFPPVAAFLVDEPRVALFPAAWSDPFLALGARLDIIFGTQVTLDEEHPAYWVITRRGSVALTTQPHGNHADTVTLVCPVDEIAPVPVFPAVPPAPLAAARLARRAGGRAAEYSVPFNAARGPRLEAAIKIVENKAFAARVTPAPPWGRGISRA